MKQLNPGQSLTGLSRRSERELIIEDLDDSYAYRFKQWAIEHLPKRALTMREKFGIALLLSSSIFTGFLILIG